MTRIALAAVLIAAGCAPAAKNERAGDGHPRPFTGPVAAPVEPVRLPPIASETLANGLEVLVLEDHELPIVSMTLLWTVGAEADPPDKAGLTSLTASLLRQGTRTRDARGIAEAIDFVGGSLEGGADVDSARVGVQVLSRDVELGLDLLADVATNPSFPEEEIADLKRVEIASVRQVHDDPSELGRRHLRRLIYGDDHPYARFPTEDSIAAITRADLVSWHATRFRPGVAILAIAGDVKASAILPRVRASFGVWERGDAKVPEIPEPPPAKRRIRIVDKPDLTQSSIRVAHLGIRRSAPDYHATIVANYILGGGTFSSRLLRVLRSQEGKTYGVGSGFTVHKGLGPFGVSTSTRTEETLATLELVLAEMERIREKGVTSAELEAAKRNLVGRYPSYFETPQGVVSEVLGAKLLGVPLSEIEAYRGRIAGLTLAEVNAAAARRFRPSDAVIVIVGNAEEIRGPIEAKLGPVEVVKWTEEPKGRM